MKIMLDELNNFAWHTKEIKDIESLLQANTSNGLGVEESEERLKTSGFNELEEKKGRSPFKIFISQFNDFMIWILIAAAFISGIIIREVTDAIVILVILIINSVMGFIQEFRAEKALQALKELAAPTALVIRNGEEEQINSKLLVPGDLLKLAIGDLVPADCRVISGINLEANESMLTGEALSVEKSNESIDKAGIPLGDRKNMLFSGTTIVKGRGMALVVNTGKNTEIGKIASLVQGKEEQTPLQRELKSVGKKIGIICLAVSAVVFASGLLKGNPFSEMFLVAVALAVASIPEGLPAIVTISLALGVQRMAKNNAIVRRLSSVETLGGVSVICTDKTGTLTQNKMEVRKVITGLDEVSDFQLQNGKENTALKFLIENAVLCNDAYYANKDRNKISGDPTEAALIELGSLYSLDKNSLEFLMPREFEEPFDSIRKMMTTVHKISEDYFYSKNLENISQNNTSVPNYIMFSKGAPEAIMKKCNKIIKNNTVQNLTTEDRARISEINTNLAASAMRNLAFAFKYVGQLPDTKDIGSFENELIFSGLVGMIDPPRPEVFDAVAKCKAADINIIMVTGDHKLTAKAIGEELGILKPNDRILDEEELNLLSEEELQNQIENIKVFARVSPQHKVAIVDALKKNDHIVAMTGDGINDAPSLKRADIGLAMGITGTDVSKEASDMILTDDNFATIVKAIKEGRVIYDNLKKFILFLLSCNISEVLLMFIAIVLGSYVFKLAGIDPRLIYIPLLPVQILWMNLITDGLPALALGVNPSEKNIMERKATKRRDQILNKKRLGLIIWQGLVLTIGALFMYFIGPKLFNTHSLLHDKDVFHTCVFTTLVLTQLFHSYNFRFEDKGILRKGIFENKILNLSILGSILLQVALIYVPFLQRIFSTTSLNAYQWLMVLASSIVPVILINLINEIMYYVKRRER
ncbi:MAG: calcium-translocating P-type ATPase, PMCA-type [Candidatus Atribacteria bacterium]|nr:calcium-translocating P-type ATPase, PMCA-type [Candidatus Atribacteria bacterium]